MITATDSSPVFDIVLDDPVYGPRSLATLQRCLSEGDVVACEVVWAEVRANFLDPTVGARRLRQLGIEFRPIEMPAALGASMAWRAYRQRGGGRERMVPDFLIGAYALLQADRLLTRDRRFHDRNFPGLTVLNPSA